MKPERSALVSLHDVMPETMASVEHWMERLAAGRTGPLTLLVVPGRAWRDDQIRRLEQWAAEGHRLAAHGWLHHVDRPRGLRHRAHALFFSRRAAEHLALDSSGIGSLMSRASDWFSDHGLPRPPLYVPPAWALGRLDAADRVQVPYRWIEVLRGWLDPASGRIEALPLLGFEADTRLRAGVLRRWNRLQLRRADRRGEPVRIAIHPHDHELRLRDDLQALLDALREDGFRFLVDPPPPAFALPTSLSGRRACRDEHVRTTLSGRRRGLSTRSDEGDRELRRPT